MAKFNSEFKAKVVREYLNGGISFKNLRSKYHVNSNSVIQSWVHQVSAHGMDSLTVTHRIHSYSQDYKISVVDYIQTNEVSRNQAAAHFGISPSQASSWMAIYREQGVVGLRSKSRGRRSTMSKHKNQGSTKNRLTPTKEERYKQEITELKQKLHEAELDRDILKTLAAITKKQPK